MNLVLPDSLPYGWQTDGETMGIEANASLEWLGLMTRAFNPSYVCRTSITSEVIVVLMRFSQRWRLP